MAAEFSRASYDGDTTLMDAAQAASVNRWP
jgi:hypothetical protein